MGLEDGAAGPITNDFLDDKISLDLNCVINLLVETGE
jgi:hypothetical protein